jgi:mRNA deadenylase 3'-5' endonuclease subunit Ccr4
LKSAGYRGAYSPRAGGKLDGSAIFFLSDSFSLERTRSINFQDVERGLHANAAVVVTLRVLSSDERAREDAHEHFIVVGCIHSLFNPKRGDVKVGQIRFFADAVENARSTVLRETNPALNTGRARARHAHAFLGGDFNCVPGSPLYHFLLEGHLDVSRVDRRLLSGTLVKDAGGENEEFQMLMETGGFDRDEDEWEAWDALRGGAGDVSGRLREYYWDTEGLVAALGPSRWARSGLKNAKSQAAASFRAEHALRGRLRSCYREATREESPVTSWHGAFVGTVDYLMHTEKIITKRVLMPPRRPPRNNTLPSEEFPSDHFCVVADVSLSE